MQSHLELAAVTLGSVTQVVVEGLRHTVTDRRVPQPRCSHLVCF